MMGKNKILVGCLSLLLVLSVGYALFSDNITINGTATAKGDFDITTTCTAGIPLEYGTAETLGMVAESGYNNDSCTVVDDTVSIDVGLEYPGARRYFVVKMTNTGSITATLNAEEVHEGITGQFCMAGNKEGTGATCTEYNRDGYEYTVGKSSMFDNVIVPLAFEDEDGGLFPFDGTSSDFIDVTNAIVTLKPNQTAIYVITAYFHDTYTTENLKSRLNSDGEFYFSRTIKIDYPWQQITAN